MSFKRQQVEKWIAERCPGERFVTYVVTSTRGDSQPGELPSSLGLDPEHRLEIAHSDTFVAITDRHFVLGSRSSFRNRPKEFLHAAPIGDVRVWWFDDDEGANHFRHFVTDFGDGSWRSDRTGLQALGRELTIANAHEYVRVLGEMIGDRMHALDIQDISDI